MASNFVWRPRRAVLYYGVKEAINHARASMIISGANFATPTRRISGSCLSFHTVFSAPVSQLSIVFVCDVTL